MKNLFYTGGPTFMATLTLLLILTTAWIIYHLIVAYTARKIKYKEVIRKISYGKTMGLFTMIVGISGQMVGLYSMFSIIEDVTAKGIAIKPELVFEGITATMICTIYGILIYLFSLLLWFVASILIDKKSAGQVSG